MSKCPFCEENLLFDEQSIVQFKQDSFHAKCLGELDSWIETVSHYDQYPLELRKKFHSELMTLKTLYSHDTMQKIIALLINRKIQNSFIFLSLFPT